jgi:uncharacterized membrane protein YjjB (DUF3815 family)
MMTLDLLQTVALDFVLAGITAAGFAVLFSVPRRLLLACALLGGVAHSARAALNLAFGLPVEWTTLAASVIIGVVSVLLARRLRAPALIFAIAASIPLIPGIPAYTAMVNFLQASTQPSLELAQAHLVTALLSFLKASLILSSIAIGVAVPSLVMFRRKPGKE